jgi:hypothetical protein
MHVHTLASLYPPPPGSYAMLVRDIVFHKDFTHPIYQLSTLNRGRLDISVSARVYDWASQVFLLKHTLSTIFFAMIVRTAKRLL